MKVIRILMKKRERKYRSSRLVEAQAFDRRMSKEYARRGLKYSIRYVTRMRLTGEHR